MGGRAGRFYRLFDWPVLLVGLQLLWLLGVVAGLVIGGLGPATVATAALLRAHRLGEPVEPWHAFWRRWRAELGPAQLRLGVPILTVWVIAFYALAARESPSGLALGVVGFGYVLTLLYLPGVLAHVDLPTRRAWLLTLHVAWRRPLTTLGLGLGVLLALGASLLWLPAVVPFAFPILPLAAATWLGLGSPLLSPARPPD